MPEPKISIKSIAFSMDDLIRTIGVTEEVAREVKGSDLVMVPMTDFQGYDAPVFPNLSEEVFSYVDRHKPGGVQIGACIDDKKFNELILHHAILHVATWVGTSVLVPILTGLVSGFILEKWGKPEKTEVEFKMILTDTMKEIEYKGPANQMETVVMEALKKIGTVDEKQD